MREYKELLDLVSKMDTGTEKRTVSYVRMDVVSGEPMALEPRSYPQLLEELSSTDTFAQMSGRQQRRQQAQAQKQVQMQRQVEFPAPQQPEEQQKVPARSLFSPRQPKPADQGKWTIPSFPSMQIPKAQLPAPVQQSAPKQGWSAPVFKLPQIHRPAVQPSQAKQYQYTPIQQQPSTEPLAQAAAAELAQVVKASEISAPPVQQQAQVRPSSNLVLPKLSITDQVNELDKIIQNLKSSSFNQDQMRIVKEEVTGLAKELSSQPAFPAEGIEADMFELRRTRLTEALSLLGGI